MSESVEILKHDDLLVSFLFFEYSYFLYRNIIVATNHKDTLCGVEYISVMGVYSGCKNPDSKKSNYGRVVMTTLIECFVKVISVVGTTYWGCSAKQSIKLC